MVDMLKSATTSFAQRAEENKQRGEAALKGSFFSNLTKGKAERMEDAKGFFNQAANAYKHC